MGFNIEQYEEAITNNTSENWSNATGYTKAELISKIRTAKDSIEKLQGDYNSAQVKYDEANGRNCENRCGKGNNAPCHSECWSKERDKSTYSTALNTAYSAINTAKANIVAWQTELDDLIEKEANTVAPSTGSGTTGGGSATGSANTSGGTTGGGSATGSGTATGLSASKTKNYLIIGGAVLVLGVVGFFVFRKK